MALSTIPLRLSEVKRLLEARFVLLAAPVRPFPDEHVSEFRHTYNGIQGFGWVGGLHQIGAPLTYPYAEHSRYMVAEPLAINKTNGAVLYAADGWYGFTAMAAQPWAPAPLPAQDQLKKLGLARWFTPRHVKKHFKGKNRLIVRVGGPQVIRLHELQENELKLLGAFSFSVKFTAPANTTFVNVAGGGGMGLRDTFESLWDKTHGRTLARYKENPWIWLTPLSLVQNLTEKHEHHRP